MRSFIVAGLVLTSQLAAAENVDRTPPTASAESTYNLGVRIGGYGFRREGDNSDEGWTECQMGGAGVFASRKMMGPLFLEAGIDAYTSRKEGLATDLPISRMSGLVSLAGGARAQVTSWFGAYVQIGGGVELTRVSVPYGEGTVRDTKVMPAAFIGVGFDLKLANRTYFGMNLRTLAMGNFNYSREELEMKEAWGFTTPDPDVVFEPSVDFAAQGQFYVRRDL